VAKNEQFAEFVHNVAMHVAASNPACLTPEDLPQDVLDKEKAIYRAQGLETGKPEKVVEKIVEGRVKKFYSEVCLMEQPYVKDPSLTIKDLLNDAVAKIGENINIRRFARFQLGEEIAGEGDGEE
jgi:elongation factor Ts